MIQGALFDLDGVIADTLHFHYLAWKHMFEKLGGTVSKHSVLMHEGRNSREVLPILMKEAGVSIPEERQEDFIEDKRAYYRSIVRVSHYPGAFRVLNELRTRGFKIALVTACALKNMEHSVSKAQQRHFDFIVTGDEVPHAKPFPDPYLLAARQLHLRPRECAVIENAPLGIEAARNAGMYCIAVETTLGRQYLAGADCIIQSIEELLTLPIFLRREKEPEMEEPA